MKTITHGEQANRLAITVVNDTIGVSNSAELAHDSVLEVLTRDINKESLMPLKWHWELKSGLVFLKAWDET